MDKEVHPPSPHVAATQTSIPSPNTLHCAKKRSALSAILAALFTSQVRSKEAKPPSESGTGFFSIVCGIRPLHHGQFDNNTPLTPPPRRIPTNVDVVLFPPPSPGYVSAEEGMTSRYASAKDLHEIDTKAVEEEEEEEEGEGSSNEIDVQAEEFIAKFYEQMRLQRSDSVEQC